MLNQDRLGEDLEDIFTAPNLFNVLVGSLEICALGFNLTSTKIGDAAFLCKWYKMDEKSKKIILTIMIRSKKPQQLTAYKFSTISYASFTKIISTSWSYFTILRTVYSPPEVTRTE
ncbi:hypothetical protein HF086_013219 [Spodoptera exigua]|uniref:Odorant receptor n=1 Tax=Spodoptera exigua TaxID=7107 RepID=A0A922SCY1_SPOEX|nr:hypothetical protein HF086_013219 [Spodoptera exigua]